MDALIVNGPNGDQVYSLKGAELPYREFIERMGEGAITLDPDGTILYCNKRFAEMVNQRLEKVISSKFTDYLASEEREAVRKLYQSPEPDTAVGTERPGWEVLPVRIAVSLLEAAGVGVRCVVVTDMTEQNECEGAQRYPGRTPASQAELKRQYEEVQSVHQELESANSAKDRFLAA